MQLHATQCCQPRCDQCKRAEGGKRPVGAQQPPFVTCRPHSTQGVHRKLPLGAHTPKALQPGLHPSVHRSKDCGAPLHSHTYISRQSTFPEGSLLGTTQPSDKQSSSGCCGAFIPRQKHSSRREATTRQHTTTFATLTATTHTLFPSSAPAFGQSNTKSAAAALHSCVCAASVLCLTKQHPSSLTLHLGLSARADSNTVLTHQDHWQARQGKAVLLG